MPTDNKVILHIIYGIPCTGKSTTALQFAHKYNIRTIIHSDYVREIQRCGSPYNLQNMLYKTSHDAWQLFSKQESKRAILQGFRAHVEAVHPALFSVATKIVQDGFDAVLEGVHFYSRTIKEFQRLQLVDVQAQLRYAPNEQCLKKYIQRKEEEKSRSSEVKLWRDRIQTLMTIQEFLLVDAESHGIPIVAIPQE